MISRSKYLKTRKLVQEWRDKHNEALDKIKKAVKESKDNPNIPILTDEDRLRNIKDKSLVDKIKIDTDTLALGVVECLIEGNSSALCITMSEGVTYYAFKGNETLNDVDIFTMTELFADLKKNGKL